MTSISNTVAVKEHGFKSEVRALREQYNALAQAVALMMPGVLLSEPATKTGTSSAKTWRSEAFTFVARGKKESKAAAETAFTATTHDVAASKEAWFTLSVAAGGGLTITKAADQTIGTKVLATGPDNEVVVAHLGIVTGATGFDATTDDLAVAGAIIASLTFVDNTPFATVNI